MNSQMTTSLKWKRVSEEQNSNASPIVSLTNQTARPRETKEGEKLAVGTFKKRPSYVDKCSKDMSRSNTSIPCCVDSINSLQEILNSRKKWAEECIEVASKNQIIVEDLMKEIESIEKDLIKSSGNANLYTLNQIFLKDLKLSYNRYKELWESQLKTADEATQSVNDIEVELAFLRTTQTELPQIDPKRLAELKVINEKRMEIKLKNFRLAKNAFQKKMRQKKMFGRQY